MVQNLVYLRMMGKITFLLYSSVISLMVLFGVMIYLMSTVKPPKLTNANANGNRQPGTDAQEINVPNDNLDASARKYENMFYNDGLIPFVDTVQYGLEKAESEEIDFPFTHTYKPPAKYIKLNKTGVFSFAPRNVIPPLWPHTTRTILINPTTHAVTSLRPPTTPLADNYDSGFDKTLNIENKTNENLIKRRSVSNFISDENSGSIILQILDNLGHTRIEIKLTSDDDNLFKKSDLFRSQMKPDYNMQAENTDLRENFEPLQNKLDEIIPNNSTFVDEFGDILLSRPDLLDLSNVTNLLSTILLASQRVTNKKDFDKDIMNEESNLQKNEQNENDDITVDRFYEDIILSYNTSKENTNKSQYNEIDYTTAFDIEMENNTYCDNSSMSTSESSRTTIAEVDTKTNNTEFGKVIFEDDEAKNITSGSSDLNVTTDSENYGFGVNNSHIMTITEKNHDVMVH